MINIQENVPLAPLTSFRVGGNARFYVEISTSEQLRKAIDFAKEKTLDFYVLGGGTNLLISDNGFQGLIIRIRMNETLIQDSVLKVQAGAALIKAINSAASNGLSGLEKLAGIPGTVGGAVRGNAGAFGFEIKDYLMEVEVFDCKTGEIVTFKKADCEFEYRSSIFKKNNHLIILSAKLNLEKGDSQEIQQLIVETVTKRASTGLHGVKSAGSYFMNPIVKNEKLLQDFIADKGEQPRNGKLPAGWVIEQAGLRGKKIGGAAISEKHANYIINTDNATSDDVMMLVSYIKQQVRDQFGVQLQEEVNYVGF